VIVGLVVAMLGVGLLGAVGAAAASPSTRVPKVVLIVGPAGSATDRYRAEARSAASLARRYTTDVTEIYSPDATWPAVKEALQGASVVVYMGHGNGWPSRYRDALYPPSQNGFGLNPTAGGGDGTHQYFGEGPIGESVRLARNAVVLLNHLCYASGNTEPGLPEGTLAMAKQRVDNFAAGFIVAGASAVVAEAHDDPNYMLRAVLAGRGRIETAWRRAPTANGNDFAFESARSPGYIAQMDPDRSRSGFTRSIVLRKGLASADVRASAVGRSRAVRPSAEVDPASLIPSLTGTGLSLKTPVLRATNAGRPLWYRIPYKIPDRDRLPAGIQASVRWDALDAPAPAAADPETPPDFGLIAPERLGDVVAPTAMSVDRKFLSLRVSAPAAPGRYRLTVLLHDKDGVAFDADSQGEVAALIVRLTGPHDAAISAPPSVDVSPGAAHSISLWVTNLGTAAWGEKLQPAKPVDTSRKPVASTPATHARIVGTWVALDLDDARQVEAASAASVTATELPAAFEPRGVAKATLRMFAPSAAGDYLLLIDIVTPQAGSLAAHGVEPTIVRVHVAEPTPAAPTSAAPTSAAPTSAAPTSAAPTSEPRAPAAAVSPAP
jgi:hypothetical protein